VAGAKGPLISFLQPVTPIVIVDLASGTIKQQFTTSADANGSYDGLVYSQDGAHLYFSQDDGVVTIADVAADGTLTLNTQIKLPTHSGTMGIPNDPILPVQSPGANNGGLALSREEKTLCVVMNTTNQLGVIDLATNKLTAQITVGNAPRNVVIVG